MRRFDFTKRSHNYLLKELVRETALSVTTIRRAELAEDEISMTTANGLAVRDALESAGIEFIDENGGGPGCATAQTSAAKRAEIVVPSSTVRYELILMRIQPAFEQAGIRFLDNG